MTEFDSFAIQLLEESKALLEKARSSEETSQRTYLHSSLLLAISALEAEINSICDELLVPPHDRNYSPHEQGLLLEKEVQFDKGEFVLSNSLKISRISDRIEFLYFKYKGKSTGEKLNGNVQWYADLKQSIDLRNKLVHPKEHIDITINQVEKTVQAVITAIDELYNAVYKKNFPSAALALSSRISLV